MPDPILVDVDIVNRALGRIGAAPIQSLDEDTELAGQVASVYNDVVDVAHAVYQWKWARQTSALDALAPPPGAISTGDGWTIPGSTLAGAFNGWTNAFAFPADALSGPLALYTSWPNGTLRDFAVEGTTVYARRSALLGTFIRRRSPDQWSAPFRMAVTTWLAGELAIPVTHDKDLATQLIEKAVGSANEGMRGGLIGRAIAFEVATGGSISSAMQDDVVTHARFEGPWHGSW